MSLLLLFGGSASSSGDSAPSVEGSGVARAAKVLQYTSIVAPVLVAASLTAGIVSASDTDVLTANRNVQYQELTAPVKVPSTTSDGAGSASGLGTATGVGVGFPALVETVYPDALPRRPFPTTLYVNFIARPTVPIADTVGNAAGVGTASAASSGSANDGAYGSETGIVRAPARFQYSAESGPIIVPSVESGAGSTSGTGTATGVGTTVTSDAGIGSDADVVAAIIGIQYTQVTGPVYVPLSSGAGSAGGVGTASGAGSVTVPALVDVYAQDYIPRRPYPRAVYVPANQKPVATYGEGVGNASGQGTASGTGTNGAGGFTPFPEPYFPDVPNKRKFNRALYEPCIAEFGVVIDVPVQSWLPDYPDRIFRKKVNWVTSVTITKPVAAPLGTQGAGNSIGVGTATGVGSFDTLYRDAPSDSDVVRGFKDIQYQELTGPIVSPPNTGNSQGQMGICAEVPRRAKQLQYTSIVAPVSTLANTTGAAQAGGTGTASGVGEALIPPADAVYPDKIHRKFNEAPYVPAHYPFVVDNPIPVESWLPTYPDLLPRRESSVAAQSVSVKPVSTAANTQGAGTSAGVGSAQAVGVQIVAFSEPQFPDNPTLRKSRHATTSIIVAPVLVPSVSSAVGSASGASTATAVGAKVGTGVGTASGAATASAAGAKISASIGVTAGASTALGQGASIAAGVGNAQGQSFVVATDQIGGRGRMLLTGVG